jgi:hypothetical protein
MNSRGNDVSLSGIVDRDLIFLFPKGICALLGEMGDLKLLELQQWSERERKWLML